MWDWETILSSFSVKLYFSFKFCETEEKVWNCLKTMQTRVLISHLYSLHFTNTFISFHHTRGITGRASGYKGANKAIQIEIISDFGFFNFELERSWVFATNSNFLIPLSVQPDSPYLWHFKLRLFDLTIFLVWNI